MLTVKLVAGVGLVTLLAACGGGSTGGSATNYAARLASLQGDIDTFTFTPADSLPGGSATYRGVVGFNTTDIGSIDPGITDPNDLVGSIEGYYGALTVNVNFVGNALTGSVTNLADFESRSVSGRIDITAGTLTPETNSSIGGGYNAVASGTIAGDAYAFDVDGNFIDDNGEGLSIYFGSSDDVDAIGSGFAAR